MNKTIMEIDDCFSKYRISEALMAVYKLFRDEFSAWYLEMVKPEYQHPIDKTTFDTTISYFEALLKLLQPFMPFITEELYQAMRQRDAKDSIMVSRMPEASSFDEAVIDQMEVTKGADSRRAQCACRKIISPHKAFELFVKGTFDSANNCLIEKIGQCVVDSPCGGQSGWCFGCLYGSYH